MSQTVLSVTSTTWCRDSHSLFDYESTNNRTESFNVEGAATCVREREGTTVRALSPGWHAQKVEQLCRISSDAGGFTVEPAEGYRARRSWLVVRDLPEQGRCLAEGSTIRLGRFEFTVRQLATTQDALRLPEETSSDAPASVRCVPCDEASSKICRICLMEGDADAEADPLIAPCSCKGSIEHVHLGCLRHWVQTKIGASTIEGNSFKYTAPQCELCKTSLPVTVGDKTGEQPLMTLPQVQPPFIVLEGLGRGVPKALNVVSLAGGKTMSLGRSRDCDIRIQDVSLSRSHASIRFENGDFILEDNRSKFGTLMALTDRYRVEAGRRLCIQAGRTLLSLELPEA